VYKGTGKNVFAVLCARVNARSNVKCVRRMTAKPIERHERAARPGHAVGNERHEVRRVKGAAAVW